jgi:hypothetical protein
MAQDRSRSAFDVRTPKHWSGLQAQQGRLLSDDDWNEADAIAQDDARHTRAQVIGPAGSPDDGFKLANPRVTAGAIDFDLSPGTMYTGGLRATLEQPEAFSVQRDWLQQPASERPALGTERIDLAYLEVWQQPVTAIEDRELQEVALGGPDTSIRIRTMRRVHLRTNVGTESCATAWAGLVSSLGGLGADNEQVSSATLTIGYVPNSGPATDLCSPAAQLGYLGAENQAIRVEIGAGNSFLWGFDNASPLYRVQLTTDGGGAQVLHFLSPPRDEAHWPLAQQIVELLPWSAVLPNGEKIAETSAGFLTRVSASYDPSTQNIKVTPVVPAGFGTAWQARADAAALGNAASAFFYLRVWNRGADTASPPQIAFTPGTPVVLTGTGLQVTFGGAGFRQGDFWIIAARPESPAKVVPWSLETGRIAEGTRRFYAPLGLIHWRPGGSHSVFDCRPTFDPLTRPRGCCVTVSPHSGWEHTIDEVAGDDDLCLCFQPGDYTTTRTLVLRNKNVKVHGAGGASRIHGSGIEAVLRFEGCSRVEISDLAIDAGATLREGKTAPRPHLSGAITTTNCDHVAISNVVARCASGPVKNASCISIYSALPASRVLASSARVQGCELIVGANQVGLSIINYGHTTIQDNVVHVDPGENAALPAWWLQDDGFRHSFRRALIYRLGLANDEGRPVPPGATRLSLGQTPIWIETAAQVARTWQAVVNTRKFNPGRIDQMTVGEFLYELAADLIWSGGAIGVRRFPEFERYIADMLGLRTAATAVRTLAAQGIVVAGTAAHDVRITGNLVRDTPQGIHVAASARRVRNPGPGAAVFDTTGRVVISNNSVYVTLMPESAVERHGIFVGNCQSLVIEDNHLECEKLGAGVRLPIDGIRCYGFLGRMTYITRNDMIGFNTGIRIAPLNNLTTGPASMWRVVENIASGADPIVDRRLKVGIATNVIDTGNRG